MSKLTQTTGKEGEFKVIGELLKRGFDVYLPVVDTGIDCIIKTKSGFKEIQIKTRSKVSGGNSRLHFTVKEFTPRPNFYIVCYYTHEPNTFWIIPSRVFKENSNYLKKAKRFCLVLGEEDSRMRKKLQPYRNSFFRLKENSENEKTRISRRKKRKISGKSGWQRLKELYPDVKAVEKKIKEAKEKGLSNGYIKILENLKKYWKRHK